MGGFQTVARVLSRAFFPPVCAHCRKDLRQGAGTLCPECQGLLRRLDRPFCLRCSDRGESSRPYCRSCRGKIFSCRLIRAACLYHGCAVSWVHSFKYRGRFSAAEEAGGLMARDWPRFPELGRPDALVPVPLGKKRERQRGYNQAFLLAQAIGRTFHIPVADILIRPRETKPQWSLNRGERAANVAGAFQARARARNLSLILIDDVCTTGASLEACAQELLRAGAGQVGAYAFTREI